ncbi:MAG: hypothetical protein ACRDPC_09475, partial [Solirubrobacteraceae bacterium]
MRLRGLLSSLGAGGSLIAAGLVALALVGGIIAFRGWSGGSADDEAGTLAMPATTERARTASAPGPPEGAAVAAAADAAEPRATTR